MTDSTGAVQVAVTDATGAYSVVVPAGSTSLNVDETDPDMPLDAVLTTANDPQNATAVANATVASGNVGYDLPPLTISKTSSAGGTAFPGQAITYTVRVTNNEAVTQTGITLTDAVPPGTTYVASSAQVTVTQRHPRHGVLSLARELHRHVVRADPRPAAPPGLLRDRQGLGRRRGDGQERRRRITSRLPATATPAAREPGTSRARGAWIGSP